MEYIDTWAYGRRVLKTKEPINDLDELFVCTIDTEQGEKVGVLDKDNEEILSFGQLNEILEITVVNPYLVIVDKTSSLVYPGYWMNTRGSIALCKGKRVGEDKEKYMPLFDSNASFFNIDKKCIAGACFSPNIPYGPLTSFVYNYQTGEVTTSMFDYACYTCGDLENYLNNMVSPNTSLSRRIKNY